MQTNKTFLFVLLIGCFLQSAPQCAGQTAINWSSYYGGSAQDYARATAYDAQGSLYICGYTQSTGSMATISAYQPSYGGGGTVSGGDAFIAKFDNAGVRQWATYYGGSDDEQGLAVATDRWGNVYLAGYTKSATGIATANAFQPAPGGMEDAFIVKFSSMGVRLWGSYFGGAGNDRAFAIATDTLGHIYLAGSTRSAGLATANAHQPTLTNTTADEGFIAQFDTAGNRLWTTYYGGPGADVIRTLCVDAANRIVAAGQTAATSNTGIASTGAFQTSYGGGSNDGFIARFDAAGQRLWGSYFGATGTDQMRCVTGDDSGNVYLAAVTTSNAGLATAGAFQSTYGGGSQDGLLVKFDSSGNKLWATYYGGNLLDDGSAVCIGHNGAIYLTGVTQSSQGIATPGVINDTLQVRDAYIAKFDPGGNRIWGTYTGGDNIDIPNGIAHYNGKIAIAGQTTSISNLATSNSHQPLSGGGGNYDGYIMQLQDCPVPAVPSGISGPAMVCRGTTQSFKTPSTPGAQSYTWTLPTGWSFNGNSTSDSISVVVGTAGSSLVTDTIKVRANYLCGSSADTFLLVTIAPEAQITPGGAQYLCNGDSLTLYATTTAVTNWQWLHNGNLLNATDSLLMVTLAGTYAVITTNATCNDTSVTDTVVVHPLPQPTVSMSGNILTTGNYITYQWYHNGTVITGATNQSYTMITMAGTYSIEVTDTNGCRGMSADYIPTGVSDQTLHPEINIYPNPAVELVKIESPYPVTVVMSSLEGKILMVTDASELDLSGYATGWYLLRVSDANGNYLGSYQLLKQ